MSTAVTAPSTQHRSVLRRGVDRLFRDRSTGRIVVMQWPNVPLWIFLVASAVRRFADPHGTVRTVVSVIAMVGLVWWAGAEVLRGVNPFRRILGGLVLVAILAGLLLR